MTYGAAAGDFVLDVKGRTLKRVRAKPQPFTGASNQTVRVDMDIDTGVAEFILPISIRSSGS